MVMEMGGSRESFLPLRWESTGDQWWYATPIDWAAASGHYDVVRELLRLDANLLVKLTSLRRIRRLEAVWDDDARLTDAARNRAAVAHRLLLDCEPEEPRGGANRLVRAGYGGWLLYTVAAAGDAGFVRELLGAQPLLVFGEGEYGVTDILYAAARSGCPEVFRMLLDAVLSPASWSCPTVEHQDGEEFRREVMNRAVHAAARGGSLEVLRELLRGCSDAAVYRDAQGSTILHAAAARGQVEVVKDLIASFDIVNSIDDQGNTALHIAAFRGHLPVVEALITASSSLISATNEAGDTFLHMALTSFGTPGFRRLDRQIELVRQLVGATIMDVSSIINAQNDDGRTVLHLAVVGNLHSNLVELLMTAASIDLNVRDNDGMTPLDLLRKQPQTASSEILIKQLILAGGITNSRDREVRSTIASQLKMHCIVGSPGTSFKISDAEIFLHAGIDVSGISERIASFSSVGNGVTETHERKLKKLNSFQDAAKHLKVIFRWPRQKEKKSGGGRTDLDDDALSVNSVKSWSHTETPTPLRQRYSRVSSLFNNKRTFAAKSSPSSAGKKSGVIEPESPSASASWSSSSLVDKIEAIHLDKEQTSPSASGLIRHTPKKYGSLNSRLMNQSLCLGAQGFSVEDSTSGQRSNRIFRRSHLSVA
ncbi:uncharacterized protein LOC133884374 [Phragmites australis]|uniref:uncharacterized protein LOC133884374 n=1 Tax=Phragmites australis TaxID=29695 RepID=UPI002D78AF81|nr:uncharacterized protein LOC133884374 [Phragmites australis]XP_062179739.1 uncharacterized protein LOC133884374 [Phragmites australis]XP_062179740.1 uncharacterized protein LOC133884374 [Phragmites australis]XP_062179741.1 uncharacterized protein LOC133884374 [Phragmites australis]XP_062179742.1 uncharacterized protein LOC133884374 [Phragmites australis]XP_062179743.1 uncharacterized protein LOC133884374 [Phragmites australis]XP_062179744.1 uncharacterized protein LOC133884374 [Phragmites a